MNNSLLQLPHITGVERAGLVVEPGRYHVNVYLTDRAYGGPEEGGWYYDTGEYDEGMTAVLPQATFYMRHQAEKGREEAQELLDANPNADRRSDVSSVLSEGRYVALLEMHEGRSWPQTRPYYS